MTFMVVKKMANLDMNGVRKHIPVSKATIYGQIRDGLLPKSFPVGRRRRAWSEVEILEIANIWSGSLQEEKKLDAIKLIVANFNAARAPRAAS